MQARRQRLRLRAQLLDAAEDVPIQGAFGRRVYITEVETEEAFIVFRSARRLVDMNHLTEEEVLRLRRQCQGDFNRRVELKGVRLP